MTMSGTTTTRADYPERSTRRAMFYVYHYFSSLGIFREHSENIQEHSKNISRTSRTFSFIRLLLLSAVGMMIDGHADDGFADAEHSADGFAEARRCAFGNDHGFR